MKTAQEPTITIITEECTLNDSSEDEEEGEMPWESWKKDPWHE